MKSPTKPITIYIDKFPYGVDQKYENSIREAMSFWEKNANVNFKEVSTFSEAEVYVKWFKEFGTGTLGHTLNQKVIDIERKQIIYGIKTDKKFNQIFKALTSNEKEH